MSLSDFVINHHGFGTVKDILDVIVIPLTVVALTLGWARWQQWRMRRAFMTLIRKELAELDPEAKPPGDPSKWCHHLKKKFMHEEIFVNASDNRDFILSIDQRVAYDGMQMWLHFRKAEAARDSDTDLVNYHGERWLDYLADFVTQVGYCGEKDLHAEWKSIVEQYRGRSTPKTP